MEGLLHNFSRVETFYILSYVIHVRLKVELEANTKENKKTREQWEVGRAVRRTDEHNSFY